MKNIEKYLSLLENAQEGLLLTSRYARFYGAEFDIAEGIAIVTRKGSRYFTDSRYIESAQNNIRDFEVLLTDRQNPYNDLLNAAIADFGITRLSYEEEYLTVAELEDFTKNLHAQLKPLERKLAAFRYIKEDWELERMRKAQEITDKAFADVLPRIKAGMTEKQLQAELIYCILKNGADNVSFDPIVVSGPNTSLPHGVPGDRVLQPGDFITMDFGALYGRYCADMTRTVALGHATDEMRKVYDTVLAAQEAGLAATRPGIPGKLIDEAARKVIEEAGYGAYFGHGYGHGLGLQIHEDPNCNPAGEVVMQPKMVASAEPGIYLPGKFGVRIEDVVIFTEDGCENITKSPKNLIIV